MLNYEKLYYVKLLMARGLDIVLTWQITIVATPCHSASTRLAVVRASYFFYKNSLNET